MLRSPGSATWPVCFGVGHQTQPERVEAGLGLDQPDQGGAQLGGVHRGVGHRVGVEVVEPGAQAGHEVSDRVGPGAGGDVLAHESIQAAATDNHGWLGGWWSRLVDCFRTSFHGR